MANLASVVLMVHFLDEESGLGVQEAVPAAVPVDPEDRLVVLPEDHVDSQELRPPVAAARPLPTEVDAGEVRQEVIDSIREVIDSFLFPV